MNNDIAIIHDPIGANDEFVFRTNAQMMHPNDEAVREGFFHKQVLDALMRKGTKDVLFTAESVQAMFIYKDKYPIYPNQSIMIKGQTVGMMLLYMLGMNGKGIVPSVNKAIDLVIKDFSLNYQNNEGKRSTIHSESKIKSAWSDYKTVAHFWAATLLLKEKEIRYPAPLPDDALARRDSFMLFSVAREIYKHSQNLNLGYELWEIPQIGRYYAVSLEPSNFLSENQKAILDSYTTASSYIRK
jgi:hypothetical protein